jgi:hypothetical protein
MRIGPSLSLFIPLITEEQIEEDQNLRGRGPSWVWAMGFIG